MGKHLEPLSDKMHTFTGESHRLFIDGRGFDFQVLEVQPDGTMKLDLQNPDPERPQLRRNCGRLPEGKVIEQHPVGARFRRL